ncbi:hypothetical protein ACFY94_27905 [Streptomyces griseorubiginosus]|uniref:hypothetical protein n=1 Tax=Streptomyces griseorubiginosus TaxID=67304 RepID=UPI0036EF212A
MASTFGRALDSIHSSSYMATWVNEHGLGFGDERLLLEIYTGWVQCEIGFKQPTTHFTMKSYLPVAPGKVRFYQTKESGKPGSIVNTTVAASPGAMAPDEDEANVFAVDDASVRLESQTFGGIAGNPLCLVLNAKLGLLNCWMFNYTYSVNVLTRHDPNFNLTPIPSDVRPAGGANPDFEPPH